MQTAAAVGVGIAIGLAAGGAAGAWLGRGAAATSALDAVDSHAACRATEAELRAEVERLRAAPPPLAPHAPATAGPATSTQPLAPGVTAAASSADPEAPAPDAPPATGSAPAAAADPAVAAKAARKAIADEIRGLLQAVNDEPAGSKAVLALVATLREQSRAEDPDRAELAARALLRLARDGKLRPDDAQPLAEDFTALAAGAPGRPGLAGAVARAWARDARLAGWFGALPTTAETSVRETVVWALDETPSDAYRDWVVQLSQAERDPELLKSVWNEDIVLVTLTRATAPRMVAAMEPRIAQGDVPVKTRARGYFALGLIAQQDPASARAALARLAANEADPGVQAFAQGVLELIAREESNIQALEGLWDAHRDAFGKQ